MPYLEGFNSLHKDAGRQQSGRPHEKKSGNILERTAVCKTNIIGVLFQKCDPPAKFPSTPKSSKFKTTSSIA